MEFTNHAIRVDEWLVEALVYFCAYCTLLGARLFKVFSWLPSLDISMEHVLRQCLDLCAAHFCGSGLCIFFLVLTHYPAQVFHVGDVRWPLTYLEAYGWGVLQLYKHRSRKIGVFCRMGWWECGVCLPETILVHVAGFFGLECHTRKNMKVRRQKNYLKMHLLHHVALEEVVVEGNSKL